MRKLLLGLFLGLASLGFASCSNGPEVVKTVLINVPQSKWQYSNNADNNYFYATVQMPEITEAAFDEGMIKFYRVYNFDKSDAAQIELPYVRAKEELINGQMYFYTEMVDAEFGIGNATIYYTANDFDYEINKTYVPEAMQFRCVIMY